ncbi:hypothetical protein [Novosphingobium sp.]|uniref:hypothetical protein n=1 Tax=Novosphingobium sp. TaxID=1874826 RepID=UPI001D86C851|nr:hypothetical protein [Novosphingobium sp.]MBX9664261.1 hypothetical protein [Novosphingobium sp.]
MARSSQHTAGGKQASAALARWDNEGGALAPSRRLKPQQQGEALPVEQGRTG